MNPISKSNFAKQIGVTPQYMPKIEAQLTMVKVPGKKKEQIDLHGAQTLRFLADREIQIADVEPETPPEKKSSGLGNNSSGVSSNINYTETSDEEETKRNLEKLKIKEQIEQIKIKNAMVRGDLVEKKLIVSTHNKLAAIDENQLKQLNVSVSPKINGVYTRFNTIATKQILKLLEKSDDKELKTDIGKILNAGSEDRKKEIDEIIEDATGNVLKNIQREFEMCIRRMDE